MMKQRLLVFLLFLLAVPLVATAQDGQAADNSLLPEINPQDIEIRSEFQARFPGLRRQPILGFNPKPRVYQIDPNRMPFLETREEAVADISITQLGRPEPPARFFLSIPDRTNAYLRAGFGSYLTPEVNGYGFYQPNEKSIFSTNLNYRGSNGHLTNQEGRFSYLDANTRYFRKISNEWSLSFDTGALYDDLNIYQIAGTANIPQKENKGVSAQFTLSKKVNSFKGFYASFGGTVFNTNMNVQPQSFTSGGDGITEGTYSFRTSVYWPGNHLYETYKVSANIIGASYNEDMFNIPSTGVYSNWLDGEVAFQYERLFNFQTRIKGVAGVAYFSDPNSEKLYFTPEVDIKHNLSESILISGQLYGRPERTTLQTHHQYNRFLDAYNMLRSSYKMGISGEINYQLFEGNRIFGGSSFKRVIDYAFYTRVVAPSDDLGFYGTNYADANIFEIYGGASQQLIPSKFWADAKVYIRSPKLKNGGTIPYEEKLGLEAAVHFKPIQDLKISGWGEYMGKRESPETSSDLGAFLLLNFGAEYQINDTFGVYAKLLNIMDQQYEIWDGYTERPFQIFGGLTVKF